MSVNLNSYWHCVDKNSIRLDGQNHERATATLGNGRDDYHSVFSTSSFKTVFGAQRVIEWTIKIVKFRKDTITDIGIGLTSAVPNDTCKNFIDLPNALHYALSCDSGKIHSHKQAHNYTTFWVKMQGVPNSFKIRTNDIITIRLDVGRTEMSLYKNNKLVGIMFDDVETDNITYRLAVTMCTKNDSVSIVNQTIWQTEAHFQQLSTQLQSVQEDEQKARKTIEALESQCDQKDELLANVQARIDGMAEAQVFNELFSNPNDKSVQDEMLNYLFTKNVAIDDILNYGLRMMDIASNITAKLMQELPLASDEDLESELEFENRLNDINKHIEMTRKIEQQVHEIKLQLERNDDNSMNIAIDFENMAKLLYKHNTYKYNIFCDKIKTSLKEKQRCLNEIKRLDENIQQQKKKYIQIKSDLKSKNLWIETKVTELRSLTKGHNDAVAALESTKNDITSQTSIKNKRELIVKKNDKLLMKYKQFQQASKTLESTPTNNIISYWDRLELNWLKWDKKDIIEWFKYKLNWYDINAKDENSDQKADTAAEKVVMGIDFGCILSKLDEEGIIKGRFLATYRDNDSIEELGFESEIVQSIIVNAIDDLIEKYPFKKRKDKNSAMYPNDNENENQTRTEENAELMETLDSDKRLLFTCPLSNYETVFVDPIIASNGVTYERKNVEMFIRKYRKLPKVNGSNGSDDGETQQFRSLDEKDIEKEIDSWFDDESIKEKLKNVTTTVPRV